MNSTIPIHNFDNPIRLSNGITTLFKGISQIGNVFRTSGFVFLFVILFFAVLPVYGLLIIVTNLYLIWVVNRLKKAMPNINKEIGHLNYEDATILKNHLNQFGVNLNSIDISNLGFLNIITLGLFNKINRINHYYWGFQKTIDQTLFIDGSEMPPLTKEEEQVFGALNDVWGEDNDKEYAKMTHYHLKKRLEN